MPRLFLTIDTELMPLLSVLKGQNRKDAFPTLSGAEEGGGGQDAASPVSSGVVPPYSGWARRPHIGDDPAGARAAEQSFGPSSSLRGTTSFEAQSVHCGHSLAAGC